MKDYILLQTKDKRFLTHMTMKNLCELLPKNKFVRIHRSFMVNIHAITTISKNQVGIADEVIPLGDLYRKNLVEGLERLRVR